ncbi:transposase [Deinococcus oregonensis]|uniref:Transposase n=1 Tax=Deinococcus oregonensis TaxID=1805970 RepID=A0ABV6B4N5_9DEIO
MTGRGYSSDLTDQEWALLEPLLPDPKTTGQKRLHSRRLLSDAILYVLRTSDRPTAAVVPMDGFHLANQELGRLGRRNRKGAPDTFDPEGYAALLERLRQPAGQTIYAPVFDWALEEPIGSALPVFAETPLIITEGNSLLLGDGD